MLSEIKRVLTTKQANKNIVNIARPTDKNKLILAYCPDWNEYGYQLCWWDGNKFYYEDQPNDMFNVCVKEWCYMTGVLEELNWIKMKKKYLLKGGYVFSRNGDFQQHYISANQLRDLYNLNRNECIFVDREKDLRGINEEDYIVLTPRYDGDYQSHISKIKEMV